MRLQRSVPQLLACLLVLAGEAGAQSRGAAPARRGEAADPAALRSARLAELDIWMRRLAGQFRVVRGGETGKQDCIGVGAGPGIHCVISPMDPLDIQAPTMVLYGIDPQTVKVRYLQVNARSRAEGDTGRLSGNTLNFPRVDCPTSTGPASGMPAQPGAIVLTCERRLRIYAPEHGKYVLLQTVTGRLIRAPGRFSQLVETVENLELQRQR